MTIRPQLKIPDRSTLRVLFDEAVTEISEHRNTDLYHTPFYAQIGDAVFEAGYAALSDTVNAKRRLLTLSAPAGAGKTTFSYALVAAMTRYAANVPEAPYGAVFVVEERERADTVFIDLQALLPGQVAIWTADHDKQRAKGKKVKNPAAKFSQDELRHKPIAVVTHSFFLDKNGSKAACYVRDGRFGDQRALTIIDERPQEAPVTEITLWEAQKIRDALRATYQNDAETTEAVDHLLRFMESFSYEAANGLWRPGKELAWEVLNREFSWFTSPRADRIAQSAKQTITGVEKLFAFAEALVVGRAWVTTSRNQPYFVGYETRKITDRTAGAILLDATADIDGIARVVTDRVSVDAPQAS